MPTAGDPFLGAGGLPISHSPLERIGYFPNRPETPSLDDLIDAVQQWVADFLFPAIRRYTGIDLSPFLPILNNVVDNLQLLFGFLDQDTSTFDKVAAGAYLIENVLQYTGLMATIEQIGTFITGIDAATGGIISQFFADIRYIIGDPLGLGTGTVIIGSSPFDIPILAPVADLVQQLIDGLFQALGGTGPGTVSSVVSYLTSVVGDVSGLLSDIAAFVAAVGGGNMSGAGTALAGVVSEFNDLASNLTAFLTATGQATWAALGALINSLIDFLTTVPAELISGTLTGAVEVGGRAIDVLVQHLNAAGQYDAAYLLGEIGDAVTVGGTGIATTITDVFDQIQAVLDAIFQAINGGLSTGNTVAAVKAALEAIPGANILISGANTLPSYLTNIVSTGLYDASAGFQNLATSLLKNLTPTGGNIGQFNAAGLTGAFNTAVTIGGQAISSIFNGSGQFIGVLNSAATGALNTAVTVGGTSLSTLFTNINSSGQLLLSGATGALNTAVTIGGQAVSSLFNGSGQFIGVINSAATGALNTAVTVGGVALNTLFTNINSSGQLLGAGITGAINTAATVAGQTVGTIQANAQGLINGINNAAAGLLSGGSTALADAQTNLNLLLTAPAQFLQGLSGVFGITPTQDAYAAAAAAAAAQAANLAQQQSAFNAVFNVSPASAGNVSVTVDFSGMANAANMSGVMSPGTSGIGITSGAAQHQGTSPYGANQSEVFPTQTATEYQVITATLGPLNSLLSGLGIQTAICGRENSSRTTRVAVLTAKNSSTGVARLQLGCYVSGTFTHFAYSADLPGLASGGVVRVILGDPSSSSQYAMQVLYNGTPAITYTDSSHISQLGASYLYVGLDMLAANSTTLSPAIRAVTYQDNPPPPAAYPFSGRPASSVDAKGRQYASSDCGRIDRDNGGAWENIYLGPKAFATEPPSSGWSTTTLGSASFSVSEDARKLTLPSAAGDNWRVEYRTPAATSNYTITAYIEVSALAGNYFNSGLVLRDGSGKLIDFGIHCDSAQGGFHLNVFKWNSATSASASYVQKKIPADILAFPNWLRVRDDGSNRYFEYSLNGVDWNLVYSGGRTDFLTMTQIGWGGNNSGGNSAVVRLRSLSGI
ncbi:beta strand repeat-containing protein [Mycobacterium sp. 23]|uniref:beta strand repeat-containing protein n=1 Tax=Mycobacterium sp. 23 TaxID=3400424 RepID=UPI003AAA3CF1